MYQDFLLEADSSKKESGDGSFECSANNFEDDNNNTSAINNKNNSDHYSNGVSYQPSAPSLISNSTTSTMATAALPPPPYESSELKKSISQASSHQPLPSQTLPPEMPASPEPPNPPSLTREEKFRIIVNKHEISQQFSSKLQKLNSFKIVFVFDDSGSMNTILEESPLNSGLLKVGFCFSLIIIFLQF